MAKKMGAKNSGTVRQRPDGRSGKLVLPSKANGALSMPTDKMMP